MADGSEVISEQILSPRNLMTSSGGRDNGRLQSGNRQNNLMIANEQASNRKDVKSTTTLFQRSQILDGADRPPNIEVSWRDLSYTVKKSELSPFNCCTSDNGRGMVKQTERKILKNLCGHFNTGHLTALMGPSGAGKSTLLECIVGYRKNGVTGNIRVNNIPEGTNLKVALINQTDYLVELFTVKEMLIYASRLKNYNRSNDDHEDDEEVLEQVIVDGSTNAIGNADASSKGNLLEKEKKMGIHEKLARKVVRQLGLEVCIDTRAGSCSGGQQKRISIALEMISQ